MAAPRLNRELTALVDEYGFEFSEPTDAHGPRQSKYDDRWEAARKLLLANPGKTLKVISYDKPSQPYNIARAVNNGEHRSFKDDADQWTAVARKDPQPDPEDETKEIDMWSVWLTYNGEKVTD